VVALAIAGVPRAVVYPWGRWREVIDGSWRRERTVSTAIPDEALPYIGQVVGGRFFVDRYVGSGAFATVLHAVRDDGAEAAVKVCVTQDPDAETRFAREIKVMRAMPRSPHLVEYLAHGHTGDGRSFLAMEYVPGPTLADGIAVRPRMSPEHAVVLVYQLARALRPLHGCGIVHRDLKPANVLLHPSGLVKLFDFGLVLDADGILQLFEAEDLPFPLRYGGPVPNPVGIVTYLNGRATQRGSDAPRPRNVDDALWALIVKGLSPSLGDRPADGGAFAAVLFSYMTGGAVPYEEGETPAVRIGLLEEEESEASLPALDLFGDLDLDDPALIDERRSTLPSWHR